MGLAEADVLTECFSNCPTPERFALPRATRAAHMDAPVVRVLEK